MKKYEQSAHLLGVAEFLFQELNHPMVPVIQADFDRHVAMLHDRMNSQIFNTAWDVGRAMNLEQAIAYALEETV